MKLTMVIFPLCAQNPVMEETVWEQYTVTLQRVSPSVPKTHQISSHSQYFNFRYTTRLLYTVLHMRVFK